MQHATVCHLLSETTKRFNCCLYCLTLRQHQVLHAHSAPAPALFGTIVARPFVILASNASRPLAEFVDASKHLANDKVCAVCTESVRVRRIGTKHLTQYHQLSAVDHKIMKIFFNCQKILYGIKEKIN